MDIRRTFIEYNGVNRSRVFARHANRMACKGSNEKFVVIALLCYPALQWLLKAQDIDALIEKLKEENEDESVWRMSNIQRILESSMGGCKPQLRLEMRKLFFARCQQLVDEIDEAMNKAVFMNPASKPSRISLAMAMLRGSILDSDPVTAVTIRNNFDSIVEDVTAIAGDAIKPLVMQLAPNEGEAKTAEAAYLYHNTEVLLREYSRIVNPSVADENRSLRILAQGGNTLESDARCHQAQVLVQYAQLIRGAIELVKDFPGDSKLYDVLMMKTTLRHWSGNSRHWKQHCRHLLPSTRPASRRTKTIPSPLTWIAGWRKMFPRLSLTPRLKSSWRLRNLNSLLNRNSNLQKPTLNRPPKKKSRRNRQGWSQTRTERKMRLLLIRRSLLIPAQRIPLR